MFFVHSTSTKNIELLYFLKKTKFNKKKTNVELILSLFTTFVVH